MVFYCYTYETPGEKHSLYDTIMTNIKTRLYTRSFKLVLPRQCSTQRWHKSHATYVPWTLHYLLLQVAKLQHAQTSHLSDNVTMTTVLSTSPLLSDCIVHVVGQLMLSLIYTSVQRWTKYLLVLYVGYTIFPSIICFVKDVLHR